MGTASIAHAAAEAVHPVQQGLMGIMEVFLDTLVICTLTALVILSSGVPVPYGTDTGGALTTAAFSVVYGGSAVLLLAAAMTLFAVATVLGWGLYGARCAEFLFGKNVWHAFAAIQVIAVFAGAFLETSFVWQLSEAVNGLMAIPNLITLALLTPEAARLTKEYRKSGELSAGGGNYADFHQCKPL
jgi:AGCS family alanine or glycine:cation symporter